MAPLRGWVPRGRRLPAKVSHGRWKTMTFVAALRHDRIDAPSFIEGPIDGVSFCPTFNPAISSSRITSAATRANQFACSSDRSAPNSSSCQNTRRT
jgi:hypothetical protein